MADNSWSFVIGAALFVAVVLVGSVLWGAFTGPDSLDTRYNGFEFRQAGTGSDVVWVTQVEVKGQLYNIPFYYHPSETENVTFQPGLAENITRADPKPEVVYIALSPDAGSRPVIAGVEISRLLGTKYNLLNMDVKSALTRNESGTDTLVKTCADAEPGVLVIQFNQTVRNAVRNVGNCVLVEYTTPEESIRVADRFAYELLGIV